MIESGSRNISDFTSPTTCGNTCSNEGSRVCRGKSPLLKAKNNYSVVIFYTRLPASSEPIFAKTSGVSEAPFRQPTSDVPACGGDVYIP